MKKTSDKLKSNYIVVQSWMVGELGLKGNRLLVYAIIYGFSQTEQQVCTCGIEYFRAWTNSSKQGVLNTLDSLESDGLIESLKGIGGDKRKVAYRVVYPIIGKENLPISDTEKGQQTLPKTAQKGQQTLPKTAQKGQETLPKKGQQSCENRSTFLAASLDKNNNNTTVCVEKLQAFCEKWGGTAGYF